MIGLSFGIGPLRWWYPLRRRRMVRRRYYAWTHPGCSIKHSSEVAAMLCRNHDLYP